MPISAKWVNDVPASPEVLELDLPEVDLTLFPAVEATLTTQQGEDVDLTGATFALDPEDSEITITWGSASRFETAGIHTLQLTLVGFGTVRQRLDAVPIVVEELTGWHTLASARSQWPDAPYSDELLFELLDVAGGQCLAYKSIPEGVPVPRDHKRAQLMQARNIWNATKDNGNQEMGPDGLAVPVKPLDWHVRQLLRPKRGVPVVG